MNNFTFNVKQNLVKVIVGAGLLVAANSAMAQTNTFPADGNVGIGTTSPSSKLHINSGTGSFPFKMESSGKSTYLMMSNNNQDGDGGNTVFFLTNKAGYGMQYLNNKGDFQIALPTNNFMMKKNGQVGFGTTEPFALSKMHITGTGLQGLFPLTLESAENATYLNIVNSNAENKNVGIISQNKIGSFYQYLNTDGNYRFQTPSGNVPLFLTNNGNVGIGTLTPSADYKLSVNGSIRAKEVVVETGWADFVFEEDYDLKSLEEVEQYIKENKHLAEIPSAKDIEENGVNVGEIESKLLQKVEELTLYLIEADKQIKSLETRLESLEGSSDKK